MLILFKHDQIVPSLSRADLLHLPAPHGLERLEAAPAPAGQSKQNFTLRASLNNFVELVHQHTTAWHACLPVIGAKLCGFPACAELVRGLHAKLATLASKQRHKLPGCPLAARFLGFAAAAACAAACTTCAACSNNHTAVSAVLP